MRILFFGFQGWGYESLKALIQNNQDVIAVITHKRGNDNWYGSVEELAKEHNIPTYIDLVGDKAKKVIERLKPDIILSVGYRKKIPVGQAKYEINLHGGLLPRYRGGAVLNWAIINGEKEVGVTAHIMLDKFDAGDIVSQKSVPIGMQDDVLDVYKKTLELYPKICIEVIEDIEKGTLKRIPQQEAFATYTKQRKPEDGIIDWNKTSLEQYNWIRALTHPYPGAFTFLQGQKITIWKSIINNKRYDNCKNGEIVDIYKDGAIVKTKDASLLLLDIEPKISLNIGDILK